MDSTSNYDKYPCVAVEGGEHECAQGWRDIGMRLRKVCDGLAGETQIIAVECYQGIYYQEILESLTDGIGPDKIFDTRGFIKSEQEILALTQEFVTDDPVFGIMNNLEISDFTDQSRLDEMHRQLAQSRGIILVFGYGASIVGRTDITVYADMARWEIQKRMRRNEVSNLGLQNSDDPVQVQYKRAYFIDWRVCDRLKRQIMPHIDFVLDTNIADQPRMISGDAWRSGLKQAVRQPFRVVPFFDPGPWGGQWMKEVCDLDRETINFAWCFDCVPEENSLLLGFGSCRFETPSINLVFFQPEELLGPDIVERFGAEFPIRFDFLDTMEGGNLSLQVHPTTQYIRDTFGMEYTQDESYYLLDAEDDACVYLGLRENVDPDRMIAELEEAQSGGRPFEAERHVEKWKVKKHDHVLIPAGTVHCSGRNSMVLEISATPYIFTFKLWDWNRMGLDGKPRPIHLDHGKRVIQWDRTRSWTQNELVNQTELVRSGDGWYEERTGLHVTEFIETRRHWFSVPVHHDTENTVNVLNLVEGREVIVESPDGAFRPFVVHYAETFIVPASVGKYTVRPHGESAGRQCATIKAYVRKENQ